jgi:hypothetical protein
MDNAGQAYPRHGPVIAFLAILVVTWVCGGPRGLRRVGLLGNGHGCLAISRLWEYFGDKPQSPNPSPICCQLLVRNQ